MNKPNEKASSEKVNRKVRTDKQFKDNKVREDENNSIYRQDNDKTCYPYKQTQEKQFNNQPEFIDRNSDSKDKS